MSLCSVLVHSQFGNQRVFMIEVKWDFEGAELDRDAAKAAVEKILNFYTGGLAGITCPTHGQKPGLKVQGRTVETLVVSVEACCQTLLDRANDRIRSISRRDQE